MKTEWEFKFSTHGFVFGDEKDEYNYKYKAELDPLPEEKKPLKIEFIAKIVPEKNSATHDASQLGSLYITLPMNYEETKGIAHSLANLVAQRISFNSGDFRINWGFIKCERLPDTKDEEEEIGDEKHHVEIHAVEVLTPPVFESDTFATNIKTPIDMNLVSQHNITKKANHPVDKLLGFFKILESLFPPPNRRQTFEQIFTSNNELFNIYCSFFEFESVESAKEKFCNFIKAIVHARHKCAHLKDSSNFGYTPFDPKIKSEVEPYLEILEILTYEAIRYCSHK